ncbi:uncharacterized protein LOC123307920 isoform X2 [Coccinella septempunctata]|uniref:uncharacterized protein LOC123307920 isoform X2 n=1 Tax=Coccinella septempunctata TaxID=41139 RepID=UPI001D099384|nr:uncharacterized protein LOC123307920 isoform X2 [Coccinella septempunctata]
MRVFTLICVYFCALVYGQGAIIEQNVRRNLEHLDNLSSHIHHQMFPFNNLGQQIQHDVQSRLGDIEDLGSRIHNEVEHNLLPVRAMALRLQMINGIGGKTVVAFPNGKRLIAKNGNLYECNGSVNSQGDCGGSLSPLDFSKNENYCYMYPNVRVNNYLCFSSNSQGVSANIINGKVSCSTVDNKPYLLISEEDYQKMCSSVGGQPTYTYYSDVNNSHGVTIPNDNPYVKCKGNTPNVCVFN